MQVLPEKIREITRPIFQKYPEIELAYLFGSVVSRKGGKLSDIDIGVFLSENLPSKEILSIELNLIGELTSALNSNKIDLVIMNLASNTLNFEVIKCNFPLFTKDEEFRIEVEHRIHSTFLDMRYHEEMYNQIYLEHVRKKKYE